MDVEFAKDKAPIRDRYRIGAEFEAPGSSKDRTPHIEGGGCRFESDPGPLRT